MLAALAGIAARRQVNLALARTLRARANGAADASIRLPASGSLTLPSG